MFERGQFCYFFLALLLYGHNVTCEDNIRLIIDGQIEELGTSDDMVDGNMVLHLGKYGKNSIVR